MRGSYLKTLIALAVLAGVWGGSVYWNRRLKKQSHKAAATRRKKLLPVPSKDIEAFTLKPRAGQAVSCDRKQGQWEITQPLSLPAD